MMFWSKNKINTKKNRFHTIQIILSVSNGSIGVSGKWTCSVNGRTTFWRHWSSSLSTNKFSCLNDAMKKNFLTRKIREYLQLRIHILQVFKSQILSYERYDGVYVRTMTHSVWSLVPIKTNRFDIFLSLNSSLKFYLSPIYLS